ncbi:SPOR domain-containing protein [Dongshaea marina]|uniref:SPOR domain-containing protein n=1 Tax=Dongshaea marina TaxID=2047966 RepID=UPI000D3E07F1|nr:SPOR domain-containing protein [Dongshaea marina]
MSTPFQNRLVGAIVVVALAVIILPDLLSGHRSEIKEQFVTIPTAPKTRELSLKTPEISQPQSSDKPQDTAAVQPGTPHDTHSPAAKAPQDNPASQFKGDAWVIQLGVFGNLDNAKALVDKLRKQGYQAHVARIQGEKELSRVFVGPDLSKDKLQQQLAGLDKLTGLKGQLLPFHPKSS